MKILFYLKANFSHFKIVLKQKGFSKVKQQNFKVKFKIRKLKNSQNITFFLLEN